MRRAIITVAPEVLCDCLGPLHDAGLSIFGSYNSWSGTTVLGVEGPLLPPECEDGDQLLEVAVEMTVEAYGRQRLVRVAAVRLTGRTVFDVTPQPQFDARAA